MTGGAERLSICYSGREADTKRFLPVRKSPFTNPCKSPLFCSPKVNISLFLMESLQNGEILGEDRINSGFYWGSETGIYCVNLWSPGGVAESPQGDDLYASPAGRSFCAYASSRALLHVGSLSLWDRQPSNAPPLLLSPAGLATRRGPHAKTRLGLCPKTP